MQYWRDKGVFNGSVKSKGGKHHRYTFKDRKVLKTIMLLRAAGMSAQRIRKSLDGIRKHFPHVKKPFLEMPIIISGGKIICVDKGIAYEAVSGQSYWVNFQKMEKLTGEVIELDRVKRDLKPEGLKPEDNFFLISGPKWSRMDVSA